MRVHWGKWLALGVVVAGFGISGLLAYLAHDPAGGDTAVYRAGAESLLRGQHLYDSDVLALTPDYARLPFTYAPFAALFFLPLVPLPAQVGWGLLNAVSAVGVVLTVYLVLRRTPSRPSWLRPGWSALAAGVLMLALQPVWVTLGYGQINVVLMALVVVDLLVVCAARGRAARFGGVLVGVAAAIKLTPLIFVVHLLLTGRRADAARAAATFAGLQGLMLLVLPHDTTRFWTHTVFDSGRIGPTAWSWNQSLGGMVRRLTENAPWSQVVAYAIGTVLAVGALVLVRRYHRLHLPVHALLVTAFLGLLVSPVSWVHHWVWVVPLAALLLAEAAAGSRAARWLLPATLLVFLLRPIHAMGPDRAHEPAPGPLTFLLSNDYVLFPVLLGIGLLVVAALNRRPRDPAPPTREPELVGA